jgi:hypothetical protein
MTRTSDRSVNDFSQGRSLKEDAANDKLLGLLSDVAHEGGEDVGVLTSHFTKESSLTFKPMKRRDILDFSALSRSCTAFSDDNDICKGHRHESEITKVISFLGPNESAATNENF